MTDLSRKKYIERIKNVLIVVLFLITILLLSFFWKDISLKDLNPISIIDEDQSIYVPEVQDLVKPKNILFFDGSDAYAIAKADDSYKDTTVYGNSLDLIKKYMSSASSAEKIEEDQYNQVMSYASLTVRFDYSIPLEEFLEQNDMKTGVNLNDIPEMTSMSFSSASGENLFIRDKNTNSYYRIILTDEDIVEELTQQVVEFIQTIEQSGYVPYYNMADIVGVENDALMPLYMSCDITAIETTREFSISDQNGVSKIASGFFASGLDFVRKITENKGSILYMYGSSQSLLMNEDGSMEYNENFEASLYKEQGFYDSLEIAIEYVGAHGGWKNLYKNGSSSYLKSAQPIDTSGYRGYSFTFGMEYNGIAVEYTKGDILTVSVCGAQVISYQRDVALTSEISEDNMEVQYAMAPIDILTNNFDKILSDNYDKDKADEYWEKFITDIKGIKFCCIRDKQNDSLTIKPVWLVTMSDGSKFWFDPQTGELLGQMDAEVS